MTIFTALDAPPELLDKHEKHFVETIRKHGWFQHSIQPDHRPGFAYTTGFWLGVQQPELIMFGMEEFDFKRCFWGIYRAIKDGIFLTPGERTNEIFVNGPAYILPVARRHYRNYITWTRWFYWSEDFPCLQIIWSDHDNLFPWEEGFDQTMEGYQPDLTEHGWQAMSL